MDDNQTNLVLEHLKRIQTTLARHDDLFDQIILRLSNLERDMAGLKADIAGINARLDSFERRLTRIERRLDLIDHNAAQD